MHYCGTICNDVSTKNENFWQLETEPERLGEYLQRDWKSNASFLKFKK